MSESQIATSQEGTRFAELVGQAKQTTSRLEVIWNEVGYTPDEKRRQMMDLVDGFRNLCEKKVGSALIRYLRFNLYTRLFPRNTKKS